jgi:ABC-2 type transport system ATP-binding protein
LYEVEKVTDQVIYLKNGQYTDNNNSIEAHDQALIVEIDSSSSREQVKDAVQHLDPDKIAYNGGVYLVYFKSQVAFHDVVAALGTAQIKMTYIRDISVSTRRFFVS